MYRIAQVSCQSGSLRPLWTGVLRIGKTCEGARGCRGRLWIRTPRPRPTATSTFSALQVTSRPTTSSVLHETHLYLLLNLLPRNICRALRMFSSSLDNAGPTLNCPPKTKDDISSDPGSRHPLRTSHQYRLHTACHQPPVSLPAVRLSRDQ